MATSSGVIGGRAVVGGAPLRTASRSSLAIWYVGTSASARSSATLASAPLPDCTGEVLLATGNAENAAAFHREAARMHRQLGDSWQEALATMHLADCEQALGRDDASREQLAAVLTLLQQFPDARAAQLRTDLETRLA